MIDSCGSWTTFMSIIDEVSFWIITLGVSPQILLSQHSLGLLGRVSEFICPNQLYFSERKVTFQVFISYHSELISFTRYDAYFSFPSSFMFYYSLMPVISTCCSCLAVRLYPTLCDPMDYSPPALVHGLSHARRLEWVAISFFRESLRPRDGTCVSFIGGQILYH